MYIGGTHTFAAQYVRVESPAGAGILASDHGYLYENLERHLPIAQRLDKTSTLAARGGDQRARAASARTTTRPARAPVDLLPLTATVPFTTTVSMPTGY